MKKLIVLFLFLSVSVLAQTTGKVRTDLTAHGTESNVTDWVREFVFADSGATEIGPFSVGQPPIGVAITRDAVWDSAGAGLTNLDSVSYHWDSTWTASDFAYLLGFERILNDSSRANVASTDSIDFLPLYDEDGNRYVVQADSMRYVYLPPTKVAGAKYFYLEFYDEAGDSLVPQTEPRTLVLFYRKY